MGAHASFWTSSYRTVKNSIEYNGWISQFHNTIPKQRFCHLWVIDSGHWHYLHTQQSYFHFMQSPFPNTYTSLSTTPINSECFAPEKYFRNFFNGGIYAFVQSAKRIQPPLRNILMNASIEYRCTLIAKKVVSFQWRENIDSICISHKFNFRLWKYCFFYETN